MKKHYLIFLFIFSFGASYAQDGVVSGTTYTTSTGVTKTAAEIIAYEKAHPLPPNFIARLRPELEGPEPQGQNPAARSVSKAGLLVTPAAASTPSVSLYSSQPAFSNFLTIWGSYAGVAGNESPYTPPDNCGDVGFTQVVATANTRLKVFDKPSVTGTAVTTPTGTSTTTLPNTLNLELNSFFTNTSLGINSISDPHIRFDRASQRWFLVAI